MKVTVFDFTGIYENESFDFYKKEGARSLFDSNCNYVTLTDISGTNCICDDYAYEEIKKRIPGQLQKSEIEIRFFDNGNYHYMSKLLLDVICDKRQNIHDDTDFDQLPEEDVVFDLIVFDHHPDMKWTSYGDILSCGSWILNALKDRPEIQKVYIIGADKALMEEAFTDNPEIEKKVRYLERFDAFKAEATKNPGAFQKNVYISVDKDVLSRDELFTNWDQGDMTCSELEDALVFLKEYYMGKILAVDVCGECLKDSEDFFMHNGAHMSNIINRNILSVFLNY